MLTIFGLSVADLSGVVAAICTAILLGFVVYDHWPREAAMPPDARKTSHKSRKGFTIVMAAIACAAMVLDVIDRHWTSAVQSSETPLGQSNARLDVSKWEMITPQPLQINASATIINNGKNTAAHMKHSGMVIVGQFIDQPLMDGYFYALTQRVQQDSSKILSEINVGENDVSYPIQAVNLGITDALVTQLSNGANAVFMLNVMQYQDYTIGDRHIYGEQCAYLVKGVAHQCEGGHNRTYVASAP